MKKYFEIWWQARNDNPLLFYGALLVLISSVFLIVIAIRNWRIKRNRRIKRDRLEKAERERIETELAIKSIEKTLENSKKVTEYAKKFIKDYKAKEKERLELEESKRKVAELKKLNQKEKEIDGLPQIESKPVKPLTKASKVESPLTNLEPPPLVVPIEAKVKSRLTSTPYGNSDEVELRVIESIPSPSQSEPKRIGYIPSTEFQQKEPYKYAVVKMPRPNSLIKFPRKGRSDKKGFKEDDFFDHLKRYFGEDFLVSNDKHVPTKSSRPYEPDLIIISEKAGKNIFINIEIDEPYDGFNRTPTHCINDNDLRDDFFTKRGWIVIRFAEIQVHLEPKKCCAFIAKVVTTIDSEFSSELLGIMPLVQVEQWDSFQAKKWAKENYREKYLGIQSFGSRSNTRTEYRITDSKADQECEKEVPKINTPNKSANTGLSIENSNTRDKRIKFEPISHRYYIDGNPDTISVTQLIDRFFPEFDSDYWAPIKAGQRGIPTFQILEEWESKRDKAALAGTALHEAIENYYNGREHDTTTPEFQHFLSFKQRFKTMIPYRSEWRIFDEDLLVAGTVDMVYQKDDGSLYMFDWKRSEKVVDSNGNPIENNYQTASGELSHLGDSSYNRYCLQQNIYKAILEKRYNKRISSMNLLVLHEKYQSYHLVQIPNMDIEVAHIMNYALRSR